MALRPLLEDLGLTPSEARLYLALLERPDDRVQALAHRAGVPRSRGYALAASLVRRGLASERAGLYKRYHPVAPAAAIRILLDARRQDLEELERRARALGADGVSISRASRATGHPTSA